MVYTKDIKAYIVPVKTEDGSTVEIKAVMIGIVRWFKGSTWRTPIIQKQLIV